MGNIPKDMLENRIDMFWGLTCIPVSLFDKNGAVLMQYPPISHSLQLPSVAGTYMPMIAAGELLPGKAYIWPAGSTAYHAIIPLDNGQCILFGPVFPENISYDAYLEDLRDDYSTEDIWLLYNLAIQTQRLDITDFIKYLMLFMNYVVKQSYDAKDPDDWNLLQKTGMHNAGRGEMNVENLSYGTPCSLLTSIRQADVVACAELVKDRLFFRTSENRCENIRSMQAEAISCLAAVMYSAVEGGLPQSEFREYIQAEKKLISAFTKMEAFDTWFRRLVCDICFQVSVVKDKIQVPPDLDKCLDYINANPCHKYTVDELADILGISKSTINRCFKKYLNTTPAKYIMDVKLQEAEKLLRTTVVPISEIAYTYGFSSQSHFSKCFAEKYQKTPLQYRKSHKSQK